MTDRQITTTLTSPEDTCALAARLGPLLRAGDVILLTGGIGAGKTHFARCLIRSVLLEDEDIPSPTFTLVQVYDTRQGELWHSDLYRLSGPDDCVELGLTDAFETAICLVEWPDKLQDLTPETALWLGFDAGPQDDARNLTLTWHTPRWDTVLKGLVA
ncbi:tRNA (adenosine(37)-N6)-threonylcarbamoyltransferase complex ATPase subunit type 1 TsaE [Tropicibacter oceani]|uniref:tRNA threonylcarbamoyladenosine biosynthesis protein TsaE n=1 Tax=Tropicibacter oceani TaxID=3058420 RepID=A0ABY8QL63_9RHOB|nr:tRNA (adenosine(37)-N6)-threonylcarbamoyltransferase complex ATPase subunit type 1 TsaE [Tropicibacter oceani]WGW04557.1 tRNA (adenosine(37)-N6)-threonylcarbamoyltransferase complex ATPase subunit type 1 TsaE [Tropicibacter oceani]